MRPANVGVVAALASVGLVGAFAVVTAGGTRGRASPEAGPRSTGPNIVFVLTDDLESHLLRFMPTVRALQHHGLTFDDYFVSDSLCCPSRASILTGQLPHDSGVWRNAGFNGGVAAFDGHGDAQRTFAVVLRRAGYRTALLGKYLNGYSAGDSASPNTHVPPGWSEWDVAGWGYPEFDYWLNQNGTAHFYGRRRSDYLTDVLARKAVGFIERSVDAGRRFFLALSTFAPHYPYTPAPRDAHRFGWVRAPRPPAFNRRPTHSPPWLARPHVLTLKQLARINRVFRREAESVQAVDRMIATVEAKLFEEGVAENTYIVFSSDNGYHIGDYGLMPGKLTPFDTDIRVPLIVVGPGVPADAHTYAMTENVDLAATFAEIGGARLRGDGHSLLSLFHGRPPRHWRNAVLVEHHGRDGPFDDPDGQSLAAGDPGPYEAIRTSTFLYVEHARHNPTRLVEFYDLQSDPFELDNIAGELTRRQRALLHADLAAVERCHNANACWTAMHVHDPR